MQKIKLNPRESHIGAIIEKVKNIKNETGVWNVKIYFSINNVTDQDVRIININVDKYYSATGDSAALTVGARDGVDLTVKDSLFESDKYYDIKPAKQQTLVGTLDISRWDRIPTNKTDGSYTLAFTISIDYYCIYNKKRCLLKVTAPSVFYFHFDEKTTPIEGELLCFDEKNIHSLLISNIGNVSGLLIANGIKNKLAEIKNSAYLLSESEEILKEAEKEKRNANLDIIAKMRASPKVVNNINIKGSVFGSNIIIGNENKINGGELSTLIQELTLAVEKMAESLPADEAECTSRALETIVSESKSETPNREWWEVSVDGLSKAATNLGKIGEPVLEILAKVAPILLSMSK